MNFVWYLTIMDLRNHKELVQCGILSNRWSTTAEDELREEQELRA
jgi:hypothetical protein